MLGADASDDSQRPVGGGDASDFNGFTLGRADAYNVLVEAVDNAGSAEPGEVLTAPQNLEGYAGVSVEISYAGTDGTPDDRTIGFFDYSAPGEDGSEGSSEALFGLGTGE
jgi:branched-chain amino acid transport system substrate-binding protein